MKIIDLRSKCNYINRVQYSEENKSLEVNFKDNINYRYHDVPPLIFKKFIQAEFPGKYFRHLIRDHFECSKLK